MFNLKAIRDLTCSFRVSILPEVMQSEIYEKAKLFR